MRKYREEEILDIIIMASLALSFFLDSIPVYFLPFSNDSRRRESDVSRIHLERGGRN